MMKHAFIYRSAPILSLHFDITYGQDLNSQIGMFAVALSRARMKYDAADVYDLPPSLADEIFPLNGKRARGE
eukprot:6214458-Pleurochrysis_carterae.AAC.16